LKFKVTVEIHGDEEEGAELLEIVREIKDSLETREEANELDIS
jgi:hypothetical protein|tara:strand:+ start:69 stop:197 length:129 start_codon:yes stop_codon:yes gene_type:complete